MGELRRKQVRQAATEAETQNLVMANRSLTQRVDDAKRGEAQIKKEFDRRRTMTNKWESDLMAKLKTLREEQKKRSLEEGILRRELARANEKCERLQQIVDEAEEKKLRLEQHLEAVDISNEEIERLKAEVMRLSASERAFQGRELAMERAMEAATAAETRAAQSAMKFEAQEGQLLEARGQYETQIKELSTKLSMALKEGQRKRDSEVTAVYEGALAANRAKLAEMQKQHTTLLRKYTAVRYSLLDCQCKSEDKRGGPDDVADPELSDVYSCNATPPLGPVSTSVGSIMHRPSTSKDSGVTDATGAGKTSSQVEKFFGRGKKKPLAPP
jgi:hypothetical protein